MHEQPARYTLAIAHPRYAPVAREVTAMKYQQMRKFLEGTCATGVSKKDAMTAPSKAKT